MPPPLIPRPPKVPKPGADEVGGAPNPPSVVFCAGADVAPKLNAEAVVAVGAPKPNEGADVAGAPPKPMDHIRIIRFRTAVEFFFK